MLVFRWPSAIVVGLFALVSWNGAGMAQSRQTVAADASSPSQTSVVLAASGTQNNLTFACSVAGPAIDGVSGPTGTISLKDLTSGQTVVSGPVGSGVRSPSFQAETEYAINAGPSQFIVSDFTSDNYPDLVVVSLTHALSILVNNGDGTFASPQTISTPYFVADVAMGDFNGDGKMDLAILGTVSPASISILVGNGNGTFQAPKTFSVSGTPSSILVGDFNGDKKLDIVLGTNSTSGSISTFLGNGDGTFQSQSLSPAIGEAVSMAAGDFDGDGKPDLVVYQPGKNSTSILLNDGGGVFEIKSSYRAAGSYAVGDFNSDGRLDLVLGESDSTGLIATNLALGNGDGTFQIVPTKLEGEGEVLSVGDFNGDGVPDLAGIGTSAGFWTIMSNGNGTFYSPVSYTFKDHYGSLAAADLNLDGKPDLITGDGSAKTIGVRLNVSIIIGTAKFTGAHPDPGIWTTHQLQCSYPGDVHYNAGNSNLYTLGFSETAAPTISLATGKYSTTQNVTLSDTTAGASIYYTTDGTTPTVNSTKYTGTIKVPSSLVLKAFAAAPGTVASAVAEAAYTIAPAVAAPIFTPAVGTYTSAQKITITDATAGAVIYYTTNGAVPAASSTKYTGPILVSKTTTIQAIAVVSVAGNSAVASATYVITSPAAATPVFTPAAGSYGSEQLVTIADATPGAVVYYTTDGSAPTVSSAVYSAAIPVVASETIQAFAVAPNFSAGAVASASYVVVGTPSILTVPATSIGTTSAVLNALVNPGGVDGSYVFQYGLSPTALAGHTAALPLAATSSLSAASFKVSSLHTKTTYYFNVVLKTIGGSATSAIVSFTTN